MNNFGEKNTNQPSKILLYSFEDPEGEWEQEGTDWWRWALPVYRMPQGSWDETTGFTRQKIWFIEKVFSEEPTDPNSLEFPPWLQCYWDSQAGRWVIISPGGGSGDYVAFEFADEASSSSSGSGSESGSSSDEVPDDCASRSPATGPFFGRVIRKSCGMDTVPGEDADGLIELIDDLGILDGRDYRDIAGRIGFAVRMKEEASGSISGSSQDQCYWMIVIVNFWRVVQVVTDVIFGEQSITIKRKNLTVWDDCSLPDEVIEGTDCPEPGSGSSSSSTGGV
jgi:hypothetical protein